MRNDSGEEELGGSMGGKNEKRKESRDGAKIL